MIRDEDSVLARFRALPLEAQERIAATVISPQRVMIVKVLIEKPSGISISSLAKIANVNRKTVYKVLAELKAMGLLIDYRLQSKRGRPRIVRLKRDHPYAKLIEDLVKRAATTP